MSSLKKWVLVADDEPDIRELITNFLEMHFGEKIKVITAADGVEATNRLPFQAFDCIITDLKMPRREGPAFIKACKQSALNESTPIIVVTGAMDHSLVKEYKSLHVLEKPVKPPELMSLVETQLKLGKLHERLAADLLNAFISSVQKFIEKTLEAKSAQGQPGVIRQGEDVSGEVIRVINVTAGKSKDQFAIGFTKKMLEALNLKVGGKAGNVDYKHLATAAGSIVFKHAVQFVGGSKISLVDAASITPDDKQAFKDLRKKKGLVIPIDTELGSVHIQAVW